MASCFLQRTYMHIYHWMYSSLITYPTPSILHLPNAIDGPLFGSADCAQTANACERPHNRGQGLFKHGGGDCSTSGNQMKQPNWGYRNFHGSLSPCSLKRIAVSGSVILQTTSWPEIIRTVTGNGDSLTCAVLELSCAVPKKNCKCRNLS